MFGLLDKRKAPRDSKYTDNEATLAPPKPASDQLGGGIDDVHTAGQKRLGARGG